MHLRGSDTAIINKATKQTAAHKRQGDVKNKTKVESAKSSVLIWQF